MNPNIIHECYTIGKIMQRYYKKKGKTYEDPSKAIRQYRQDKNIDRKLLRSVVREIYNEQLKMLT